MRKKKKSIWPLVVCLAVLLFAVSAYHVVEIVMDYDSSNSLYEDTTDQFVKKNSEPVVSDQKKAAAEKAADEETVTENDTGEDSTGDEIWSQMIDVDLEGLQEENEDIIGWIYFENEDISYPILYSGDNSTYLRTSYTHESMTAGSIFMDGSNRPDFSDSHTIIYGHNMKDLSMFGKLKYYRQKTDYYEGHEYFQIITKDRYYRYRIFSYKEVDPDSELYTTSFGSDESFDEFIHNTLLTDSMMAQEEELSSEDFIITLSTCSTDDKRFTVSAKRVAEADRDTD